MPKQETLKCQKAKFIQQQAKIHAKTIKQPEEVTKIIFKSQHVITAKA
jgi:hypothetical protein